MHISIICFSLTGYTTAEKIQKSLQQCGYTADLFKKSKYLEDSIAENTAVWTGHHFQTDDGLICRCMWNRSAQHCPLCCK